MRVDLGVADALGNVEFEVAAGHEYPLDQKLFFVSRKDAKARRCRAGPRANPVAAGDIIMKALRAIGARRSNSRSEEHTSELQSLMRISYAVFCLKKKQTEPHK